jgi:hypothetical protein
VVRIPNGQTSVWRRYAGGQTPPWPNDQLFALDTTGLTPPAAGTGPAAGTVTWLGTPDLNVTTLTAPILQAALNATTYGGEAVCDELTDTVGGIGLSLPDYSGEPVLGNRAHRFSAFGYADGGKLRFYSNLSPQEYNGSALAASAAEANYAPATAILVVTTFSVQAQRADKAARQVAGAAFRVQTLRDESVVPTVGLQAAYAWTELAPGPGRNPRSDDERAAIYDGISASPTLMTSETTVLVELSGNQLVPRYTETWIDPSAGYVFRWPARAVPRYARHYTSAAYLTGLTADVVNGFTQQIDTYQPRLLLEADPDDPRINSGRVYQAPLTNYPHGRYLGAFPSGVTGLNVPPTWTVPTLTTVASGASGPTGLLAPAVLTTGETSFDQNLGNGNKAVKGAVFLFPPATPTDSAYGTIPASDWNLPGTASAVCTALATSPTYSMPGRSMQFDVTLPSLSDPLSPCTVTLGTLGAVGPFCLGTPVAHVQGLLDALLGADQSRVVDLKSGSTRYGWRFLFAGGTAGRLNHGAVSVPAPYTLTTAWAAVDGSADNWETLTGVREAAFCRIGTGGGGVRYGETWATEAAVPFVSSAYYYTVRQLTVGGMVGPAIGSQVHIGANQIGDAGTGIPAGPAGTLEVATGTVKFPFAGLNLPGNRFTLPGTVPMECAAGKGYPTAIAGNYGPFGSSSGGGSTGSFLEFHGGLCTSATSNPLGLFTGSFPTRDGRTAVVNRGFIMSVS